jgi:hypothetical protein
MKLPRLEWPTAVVLVAVIAAIVAVWITAPDHRGDILAALGTTGAAVLALMRALFPPPPPPPAAPPSPGGDSDGPPTRPRRVTMPSTAARVGFDASEKRALDTSLKLLNAWHRETRRRIPRLAAMHKAGAIALVSMLLALTGCGASALRTHQTIATIARVSVVAAHPAIDAACEVRMHQCTDATCLDGVRRDCETAIIARGVVHEAVESYVDTIKIAAHAEEGRVGPALDTALTMLARAYETARDTIARTTGYQLPELPPEALAILRALASGAASLAGGA